MSTVLSAGQYQLVQVEAPDVPPAELRAAMRWKLREAIDFPVEDAIVDVFDLPPSSRGGQNRMVYAVAARRSAVADHSACFARNGDFDVIDIPELALRNLAMLPSASAAGLAFVHLGDQAATVVLVRGGTFYFARQMILQREPRLGADGNATATVDAASVALELQRSLDYYERQFDQPPIANVMVAPAGQEATALAAGLASETGLAVSVFDINEHLSCPTPVEPALQAMSLLAIGAALRQERRTL